MRRIKRAIPGISTAAIIYGGDQSQERSDAMAVPLADLAILLDEQHA